ncbi:MAG: galactokinase [Chloroflexota bacterium]|nr:galactokinase [Chloroflexota bacterium]
MGDLATQVAEARAAFERRFGREPQIIARAPGRVNLIGEHTDYNDGFVLPVAIDCQVLVAAAPRPDRTVHLYALDFEAQSSFSLEDIQPDEEQGWSNYQRGVGWALQEEGLDLMGLEAVITSDVPIGSGLSSSAAIEVSIATAWKLLSGFELDPVRLALLCQKAENEFVGANCGIMDQFISVLGQRDHALLVDCRSLDYQLVPVPRGAAIVVADTMKRRGLVDSEYNARRRECEEGVQLLREHISGVRALRDVTPQQFAQHAERLPPVIRRRCRHVIEENARVEGAVVALDVGDLASFGELMIASHRSLRDDYEVSCRELDVMMEAALKVEGVYGSRMTGAGFGGCTVSLVREKAVLDFRERVAAEYEAIVGVQPQIYVCRASDGAGAVRG